MEYTPKQLEEVGSPEPVSDRGKFPADYIDNSHLDQWDTICHHDPVNVTAASMMFNQATQTDLTPNGPKELNP
jgi:hypothetical protein